MGIVWTGLGGAKVVPAPGGQAVHTTSAQGRGLCLNLSPQGHFPTNAGEAGEREGPAE